MANFAALYSLNNQNQVFYDKENRISHNVVFYSYVDIQVPTGR